MLNVSVLVVPPHKGCWRGKHVDFFYTSMFQAVSAAHCLGPPRHPDASACVGVHEPPAACMILYIAHCPDDQLHSLKGEAFNCLVRGLCGLFK